MRKIKTVFFDCDGVIFDSNNLKTKAFEHTLSWYSQQNINKFIEYHKSNMWISRYKKFEYFFTRIFKIDSEKEIKAKTKALLELYWTKVKQIYRDLEPMPWFIKFIKNLPVSTKKYIVSWSDEKELKKIFNEKWLSNLFTQIYWSPKNKHEIIKQIEQNNNIENAIYIWDARSDYIVCKDFNINFLFLKEYSLRDDYEEYNINKTYDTRAEIITDLWII